MKKNKSKKNQFLKIEFKKIYILVKKMNDINNFFNTIILNYQKKIINEYPSVEILKLQKLWDEMSSIQKPVKNKNEPKKPKKKTAYQNFFVITRKKVTDENPNIKFGEISKIISGKWNSLSREEKKTYEIDIDNKLQSTSLNNMSSTPYINLFENDDDEKSKNDIHRSVYEHDEEDDMEDAISDLEEDDGNLDEINFDDDMD